MNAHLSDDLLAPADAAPLLRQLRAQRRRKKALRAASLCLPLAAAALYFRPATMPPIPEKITPLAQKAHHIIDNDTELLASFEQESVALVNWPDGRRTLLVWYAE